MSPTILDWIESKDDKEEVGFTPHTFLKLKPGESCAQVKKSTCDGDGGTPLHFDHLSKHDKL